MTIPEIKLTQKEVCEAVGEWISKRGITVPVTRVEEYYTGRYTVTLLEPEEESPAPAAVPAEPKAN